MRPSPRNNIVMSVHGVAVVVVSWWESADIRAAVSVVTPFRPAVDDCVYLVAVDAARSLVWCRARKLCHWVFVGSRDQWVIGGCWTNIVLGTVGLKFRSTNLQSLFFKFFFRLPISPVPTPSKIVRQNIILFAEPPQDRDVSI